MRVDFSHNAIIARLPGNKVLVERNNVQQESAAIKRLQERDNRVRAHEAAHLSDPRIITVQSPHYVYQIGPDGKPYAIGGSVAVTTQRANNRAQALENALALKSSAASDEPSAQDAAATAASYAMINEALSKDDSDSIFDQKA